MYPAPIESLHGPTTIEEALRLLAEADKREVMCIAGGMSLMQAVKARVVRPEVVVDLNRLDMLRGVERGAGGIEVGSMTCYVDLAREPLLRDNAFAAISDAAARVGDRQVRNRGTIGGSLCWNYVAACLPAAALAVDGQLELLSLDGDGISSRTIGIDDFLTGPLETAREPHELLRSITLPDPGPGGGSAYKKWGPVTASLPVVGIAVRVIVDRAGACREARVAIAGLVEGTQRLVSVEEGLIGLSIADAGAIEGVFEAAGAEAEVQGDQWATEDYRRLLIREIGGEVTMTALKRAGKAH